MYTTLNCALGKRERESEKAALQTCPVKRKGRQNKISLFQFALSLWRPEMETINIPVRSDFLVIHCIGFYCMTK